MRRRWMAVIMAAAMLGTMPGFAGAVQAAEAETIVEISAAEEPQASAADEAEASVADDGLLTADDGILVEEPEAAGAGQEEPQTDLSVAEDEAPVPSGDMDTSELEANAFPVPDGFLLGIETADDYVPADDGTLPSEEDLEVVETLTGTGIAGESGLASTAANPQGLFRTMAAGQYSGSFGAQLDGNAKSVYDAMRQKYVTGLGNGTVTATLSEPVTFELAHYVVGSKEIDKENEPEYITGSKKWSYAVQAGYDALIYDFPQETFWIKAPTYNYEIQILVNRNTQQYYGRVRALNITPQELYSGASGEIGAFRSAVDAAVSELWRQVPEHAAKADIVRVIHDYLCGRLTYKENAYAHSAAGVFLKGGEVVCEGYAKSFRILCDRLGVECVMIVGKGTPSSVEDHMWNYVLLEDNRWYLVDVTWDDPSDTGAAPRYDYFLKGSGSAALSGGTIGEQRTPYQQFSGIENTMSFVLPVLNSEAYAGHIHTWEVTERTPATCMTGEVWKYHCTDSTCGAEDTKTVSEAVPHMFVTYTPGEEADALHNATETALCEYGCGTRNTREIPGTKLPATIQLNYTSLTLQEGQKFTGVQVSGLAKGDYVAGWESAKTDVAAVKGTGAGLLQATITGGKTTSAGKTRKTRVKVTLASGLSKSIAVSVQKKPVATKSITVPEKKVKLTTGDKYTLEPTVSPVTSKEKIQYTSSAPAIAKVTSKGKVTAVSAGKAKITVQSGSQKVTVTVTVKNPPAERIDGVPATLSIKKGKTKTLEAELYPAKSSGTIKYSSSNKKVVSVTSDGKLTARKKGTADITVKCGKLKVTCTVTVK